MLASKYNPTIQRGGTFEISITAKDTNDVARDFSGYDSMRIDVRPAWVGKPGTVKSAPLLSLSTVTGEIVLTDAFTITITISAADTADLMFNTGKYELEMIIDAVPGVSTEIVDKLLYGTVSVTGEIVV